MIFISAGHHPSAPGACYGEFCEHWEAVRWADRIVELLDGRAIRVPDGHLKNKVAFINSHSDATLAVEIHFNAAVDAEGNPIGNGCESLYYPGSERGRLAAETIQMGLARLFPPDRGVKEGWYRMQKRFGPDYFLAWTRCPAVIVEPEFIHHQSLIQDNRELACVTLAEGIGDAAGH